MQDKPHYVLKRVNSTKNTNEEEKYLVLWQDSKAYEYSMVVLRLNMSKFYLEAHMGP